MSPFDVTGYTMSCPIPLRASRATPAATVAGGSGVDGRLLWNVLLGEAGERVEFAQDRDHRTIFTGLADHRGRNGRDVPGDTKPMPLELSGMLRGGACLGIAQLRRRPDPVGKRNQRFLLRVDELPDVAAFIHGADVS